MWGWGIQSPFRLTCLFGPCGDRWFLENDHGLLETYSGGDFDYSCCSRHRIFTWAHQQPPDTTYAYSPIALFFSGAIRRDYKKQLAFTAQSQQYMFTVLPQHYANTPAFCHSIVFWGSWSSFHCTKHHSGPQWCWRLALWTQWTKRGKYIKRFV